MDYNSSKTKSSKTKKSKTKVFSKIMISGISGIFGIFITVGYQYFFSPPQSFTFIYDGDEVVVTKTDYLELVEENADLSKQLEIVESQLSSLQTEIENQDSIQATEQLIKQATDYWNNADYVQALSLLKNTNISSEDIQLMYSNYSAEYTLILLSQADSLIAERNYDEAISILTSGQDLVLNSTEIKNKINQISENAPIKLSKLKITSCRFFELENGKSLVDTIGNSYPSGNCFTTYAEGDSKYGYASFYLGKKYSGITGTIAVSDESEDAGLEGWIEIYSIIDEDYARIYKSPVLNRMSTPISLPDLDLSNSDWIEIRYYNNENYYSLSKGYLSLEIIISDITLYSM